MVYEIDMTIRCPTLLGCSKKGDKNANKFVCWFTDRDAREAAPHDDKDTGAHAKSSSSTNGCGIAVRKGEKMHFEKQPTRIPLFLTLNGTV